MLQCDECWEVRIHSASFTRAVKKKASAIKIHTNAYPTCNMSPLQAPLGCNILQKRLILYWAVVVKFLPPVLDCTKAGVESSAFRSALQTPKTQCKGLKQSHSHDSATCRLARNAPHKQGENGAGFHPRLVQLGAHRQNYD